MSHGEENLSVFFEPEILAFSLVSALNADVGTRAWAIERFDSDFCDEVNICSGAGRLWERRRAAESEARTAGLGVPPRSRSRFRETPLPAIPFSPLETESVFALS